MADEPMPVRLSHLLRECAVGAVVRGPDYLLTVKDTRSGLAGAIETSGMSNKCVTSSASTRSCGRRPRRGSRPTAR